MKMFNFILSLILLMADHCFLAAAAPSDQFFYLNEPVVNMREHPTLDSKVVSQAVFSENIIVHKEDGEWSWITTPDGYSGWVLTQTYASRDVPYEPTLTVIRRAAHIYHVKDTEYGPIKTLPYGSRIQALDTSEVRWIKIVFPDNKEYYMQKGDVSNESFLLQSDLAAFSQTFLGLPYTWGGRSSFGYDCSGFVQMLYSRMGIDLQRDSKQQVLDPRFKTIDLENLQTGDLIFFGKSEQRIMHVGLSLGDGQFIHSTVRENQPWIRISRLTDFEWSGDPQAYYCYRKGRQFIGK